jgi:hypothetical protein
LEGNTLFDVNWVSTNKEAVHRLVNRIREELDKEDVVFKTVKALTVKSDEVVQEDNRIKFSNRK